MKKQKNAIKGIDQPRFRYWQALYHSFYDGKVYVDAAKRWKGLGIFYIFFVSCIVLLPFSIRLTYEFKKEINAQYLDPLYSMPLLFVHDGRLIFDKPMPYLIKNKYGKVVAIIDTTKTVTNKIDKYKDLIALLEEKRVIFWPPSSDDFTQSIPTLKQLSLGFGAGTLPVDNLFPKIGDRPEDKKPQVAPYPSPNEVFDLKESFKQSGLNKIINIFMVIIYPSIVLFVFVMTVIFLLVFAMMGQLLGSLFFSYRISYQEASRMLAVAFTPTMALLWLAFFFNLAFPGIGMILFALSILYFCYGVISLKRESKTMVRV